MTGRITQVNQSAFRQKDQVICMGFPAIAVDLVDLGLDFFPFPVVAHELSIDLVIEVVNVANNGTSLCMLQHELVTNVDIAGGSHNQVKHP